MKAIITMELVRPTRFKRLFVEKKIEATKDMLHGLINGFIYERANRDNFIPVKEFNVKVYNTRGRMIETWNYKPTYR